MLKSKKENTKHKTKIKTLCFCLSFLSIAPPFVLVTVTQWFVIQKTLLFKQLQVQQLKCSLCNELLVGFKAFAFCTPSILDPRQNSF